MATLTVEQLLNEARSADRAGHIGDAINAYKRIARDFPTSDAANEARKYLANTRSPLTGATASAELTDTEATPIQLVRVVDVDIRFGTMVWIFVKAAIAVIPAAIILFAIAAFALGVLGGLGSALR